MKNLSPPHTIQHNTPKKEQIVFYQACQKFQKLRQDAWTIKTKVPFEAHTYH